ncbi:MAG: hypothetical protein R2684_09665 [Pyrinomonadaceae bacterium]
MRKGIRGFGTLLATILGVAVCGNLAVYGQRDSVRTILVTADAGNSSKAAVAARIRPEDFVVKENKISREVLDVKRADQVPVNLAVVLQDNLSIRVNNELKGIKTFIKGLPKGSTVMTAYITGGTVRVRKDFTDDLSGAADSLRIIASSGNLAAYTPYTQLEDVMKKFPDSADGRRMVLFVSDGVEYGEDYRFASPFQSLYLDRAISRAQAMNIAVFPMFAPPENIRFTRRLLNYGQGALLRLADETGGQAFFTGSDFVTFDPYLREYGELMKYQWLIEYKTDPNLKGFVRVDVQTDFDIDLMHPTGYRAGKS